MMLECVNEILDFWFGTDKNNPLANAKLWWQVKPEFDETIRSKFEHVHHLAASGKLEMWLGQPRSCLAYIILLDQFSRNMYRNSPLAFAQDERALHACEQGRDHKLDKELNLVERQFFYMPLEHSEDINCQKLCLALMQQLVVEAKKNHVELLSTMEMAYSYAQKHYDIIFNFGRFPHRNEILERESTQEELLFLSLPGSRF